MANLSGVYHIKNAVTGTCMYLAGVTSPATFSQAGAQDKKALWRVVPQPGHRGSYKLKNLEYGVELAWNPPGVIMHSLEHGHTWIIEELDNKQCVIHQGVNSLVIDTLTDKDGNTTITMGLAWDDSKSSHKWIFETAKDLGQGKVPAKFIGPRAPHPRYPVPPGKYVIKSVMTGTVLHYEPGSGAKKARVYAYKANGSKNQQWVVRATRTGTNMYIYNDMDSKRHGIAYPKYEHGAILEPSAVDEWFGYTIFPADKGFYISPVQLPLHMVDLSKGEDENGTDILLWKLNEEGNQKWYFESV